MRRFAAEDTGSLGRAVAEAALPSALACIAHRRGDHEAVLAAMLPMPAGFPSMGGSHAQRDIFVQVLADSCLRLGRQKELADVLNYTAQIGFADVGGRTLYADAAKRVS
jgi:hypothetical protein